MSQTRRTTPALAHQVHGGVGPVLLLLHANGFHGRAYDPMVEKLKAHFTCISLDFPGQGRTHLEQGESVRPDAILAVTLRTIIQLGLQGCYCFGHSMGGGVALLLASQYPHLFTAIYAFEPVASPMQQPGYQQQRQLQRVGQAGAQQLGTTAQPRKQHSGGLAVMAAKRRSRFASVEDAVSQLGAKLPFSHFHPAALQAYIQHGTRPSAGGGVELRCRPEVESRVFAEWQPSPTVEASKIDCPVAIALGRQTAKSIHKGLVDAGLGIAAQVPACQLFWHEAHSHMGPMEDPAGIADSVWRYFASTQQAGQPARIPGSRRSAL